MLNALFPQTIFTTQHRFDDYSANDMRYGDMSEDRLKKEFGLTNISNVVDPFTLTKLTPFDNPQNRFANVWGDTHRGMKLDAHECAGMLFEEMQVTSLPYSFVGPYRHLINQMLHHFRYAAGTPFYDMRLNVAYQEKLNADSLIKKVIKETIGLCIDYESKGFPQNRLKDLHSAIAGAVLPKFDSRIVDKINGMGIAVHDVHATRIDILELVVNHGGWRASVRFTGQDHFGLDVNDIRNTTFNQFQFFKIWFVLQHYTTFGFRPFLTNMEAVTVLEGSR